MRTPLHGNRGTWVTAIVLTPCVAHATPYIVKLTQQGHNVVATGSGAFDLAGFTYYTTGGRLGGTGMIPSGTEALSLGLNNDSPVDTWVDSSGFSGSASFGNGGYTMGTTGSGDSVEMYDAYALSVPHGYVTGTALTSGATWDNATFATLGVTPGTYKWKWGTEADQSFTLDVGVTAVPEPAALGMFGLGVLLIGGFVTLRRREQPQA